MRLKFWKKPAPVVTSPDPDSNCWRYTKSELELAGWLENEGMYGDMIGTAVLDLVATFASQGHSGMSADITLALFDRVVRFKPLTEITYGDDQWTKHDHGTWQHKRNSSIFSDDQGRSWYDIDEKRPQDQDQFTRYPIATEG